MERSRPSPHLRTGLKEKCGQLTASSPLAGTLCKLPMCVPRVLLAGGTEESTLLPCGLLTQHHRMVQVEGTSEGHLV